MYRDDYDGGYSGERSGEDVYSKPVRAGKRTYFFDVKATRGDDWYLTITESKRRIERDGRYSYDKHKIFLYKEDFEKFAEGLQDAVNYIKQNGKYEVVERHEEPEGEGNAPEARGEGDGYRSDVRFEEL